MLFPDRQEAGRQLARLLGEHREKDAVILALPRGGVPVAREVARALEAPLDVFVVRKLGAPGHPELGVGAIAEGGAVFVDASTVRLLAISSGELSRIAERESVELERRARLYRRGRPLPPIAGRTVIVVDDGIATGVTARAAIRALREIGARKVILAVPVIAAATAREIRGEVDELVCIAAPEPFHAVSSWYAQFPQVSDAEVLSLLGQGPGDAGGLPPAEADGQARDRGYAGSEGRRR